MPVRKDIPYNEGLFFITFTCYKWFPLIEQTNGYDLVYGWFDYVKKQNHGIAGYVIMPNHVHAFSCPESSFLTVSTHVFLRGYVCRPGTLGVV